MELPKTASASLYAGLGLQAAGLYGRVDSGVPDDEIYGASVYLAGPTPIGTFTVGAGASADDWNFWLSGGGSARDRSSTTGCSARIATRRAQGGA